MKVSDAMTKQVDFVSSDASVKDICRLIFGRGINGVPVCKGKKVVGFVTERDILATFYPSMQEYMEDSVHCSDFEGLEEKVSEILSFTVDKIMSKKPIVVKSDTPVLKAHSIMFVKKVGRLPVVDHSGDLIGIVSKGDIFKSIIGRNFPLQEEEGFYDWSAKQYDTMIYWRNRLSQEIPDLVFLFHKEKAKRVLDIASSTGEHSIALVKKGFEVFGVDASSLMDKIAQSKKSRLSKGMQTRLNFFKGDYEDVLKRLDASIDAAIFMGNALLHVQYTDRNILKHVTNVLRKKDSLIVFQIINFEKAFKVKNGLRDFTIRDVGQSPYYKSHAFLGFYTKKARLLLLILK